MNLKKKVLGVLIVELFVLFSYWKVFNGFFQQDEWLAFGYHLVAKNQGLIGILTNAFTPSVGHYQPLNTLVIDLLFSTFKLNYLPYAIVSVSLHLVNVFLIYVFSQKLFKSSALSLVTSLLFGIMASTYQATSWVLADLGIHLSTAFGLLSLISFFDFLQKKREKSLIVSLILLIISIFFKEITIFIFAIYFLSLFLFSDTHIKKKKLKSLLIIAGVFLTYFLLRVSMIFLPSAYSRDIVVTHTQSIKYLFYNLFSFPVKGFIQTIIPWNVMLEMSKFIAKLLPENISGRPATTQFDIFVQKRVFESLNYIFVIPIFIAILRFKKLVQKRLAKKMIFSFLLAGLSVSIFALSPEKTGVVNIIDSRNLYFTAVGGSIFVVGLLAAMKNKSKNIFCLFVIILFIFNFIFLKQNLNKIETESKVRKEILMKIYEIYPILPSKVIFYTQSDTSYYGLPIEERILPFQSGLGQTLLIWYYPKNKFSDEFFNNRYLWEIKDQGYKEVNNHGFGYFRDSNLLKKTIKEYNLSTNSIIAFSWESGTNSLLDITDKVHKELDIYEKNY